MTMSFEAIAGASCFCRTAHGERVEVGNFTCLKTNDGLMEAQCDYVLNNTAWKFTGNACPSVHLEEDDKTKKISVAKIDFSKKRVN